MVIILHYPYWVLNSALLLLCLARIKHLPPFQGCAHVCLKSANSRSLVPRFGRDFAMRAIYGRERRWRLEVSNGKQVCIYFCTCTLCLCVLLEALNLEVFSEYSRRLFFCNQTRRPPAYVCMFVFPYPREQNFLCWKQPLYYNKGHHYRVCISKLWFKTVNTCRFEIQVKWVYKGAVKALPIGLYRHLTADLSTLTIWSWDTRFQPLSHDHLLISRFLTICRFLNKISEDTLNLLDFKARNVSYYVSRDHLIKIAARFCIITWIFGGFGCLTSVKPSHLRWKLLDKEI